MDDNEKRYEKMIDRYLKGEDTPEEARLLNTYFNQKADQLSDGGKIPDIVKRKKRVWQRIAPKQHIASRLVTLRQIGLVAACAALFLVAGWYIFLRTEDSHVDVAHLAETDIKPGQYGATITLGDGRPIVLDSTKKGAVIGSALTYEDGTTVLGGGKVPIAAHELLTASTAKGQTYTFVLPDGTKVWLNAASRLTFPSRFGDDRREVTLEGEGYFVIKHEEGRHFYVRSKGQVVEDLGTAFNIRAYADDVAPATTLTEGVARVNNTNLRPGQQALQQKGGKILIQEADLDQVLAWREGTFVFRGETLEEVFRSVSRWYNVDVVFANEQTRYITVGGTISRSRHIHAVLDLMERTGKVKCTINGNVITVH